MLLNRIGHFFKNHVTCRTALIEGKQLQEHKDSLKLKFKWEIIRQRIVLYINPCKFYALIFNEVAGLFTHPF